MFKLALAMVLIVPLFTRISAAATGDMLVYVGGYTRGDKGGKGIYLFKLGADHKLVPAGLAVETPNPSFLALDEKRKLLFAVSEMSGTGGKPAGAVSSFAIQGDGKLKLLSTQPTIGAGPCHVAMDKEGRSLFAANYGSGSVTMFPIAADGMLGPSCDFKQHEGSSVNPDRQKGPHAHCVTFDPSGERLFVCDLGLDKVFVYKPADGKLVPNDPPFATVKPGSGPRHIAFSPDAKFAYVINEMGNSVTTFTYDSKSGAMSEVQTIGTLPESFTGKNTCAEIVVHPSGKFLYASNRGDDSVVTFAIDAEKGTLTNIGRTSTGGNVPRFFGIDPAGTFMVMCNQNSSSMPTATINPATGQLTAKDLIETPSPTCAIFLPAADQ